MLQVGVSFRSRLCLAAVTLLLPGASIALATRAIPISPGESDRAVEAAHACPTFSWTAVASASGYELVVLDLARPDEPGVILRHQVAGAAYSWTPDRATCLVPGTYAWTVRALDAKDAPLGGGEGWAAPRRFTVPALPDEAEVAAALDVLRRWEAGRVTSSGDSPGTRPVDSSARGRSGHDLADRAVEASGTAAIRGENPATGADQHGVWGQSASSSGGGLVGVNTAGGPDLVLDGAAQGQADTRLSQSGIDRPSGSAQTFAIQNSGGGGMALQVQGIPVSLTGHAHSGADITSGTVADARIATTLTRDSEVMSIVLANDGPGSGLNADLLDGVTGTSYQRRVTGTCPPGQAITGVNSNGSVVCYEVPVPPRLTMLDGPNQVGRESSLELGVDGFPVISYYDSTNGDLRVVKCNDSACAPGGNTVATLDSTGNVGRYSSLAIGTDGFPVISYRDDTNQDLKVVKCNDAACAPGGETLTTLDSAGDVGLMSSLAIGADGFPVISYRDATNGDLKVVKCNDAACAPGGEIFTTVDSAGSVGYDTSAAIGTDGFPVISHHDLTNGDLRVVKCNDAACAPGGEILTTVDSTGAVGTNSSLAIGTDGFPVISYRDATNVDLKVVKCNDAACAPGGETLTTVDSVGNYTSLAIGSDGFPVISYQDGTRLDLKVVKCDDAACAAGGEILTTIDSSDSVGETTSVAIGTDGFPVISYYDSTNGDLKVAKCNNASCRF